MLITTLIIALAFLFLLVASYFDLKTGEIPERLSRGFIFSIAFLAFLFSIYTRNFYILGITALVGIGYFLFGFVTYYLGQWGGGDVKILTGIGLSLGLLSSLSYEFHNSTLFPYYISYFVNMGLVALPYAFFYGLWLGFKDKKIFQEFFKILTRKRLPPLLFLLSFIPSISALYFNFLFLSAIYLILPFFVLISLYLKILEKVALTKEILVSNLREGDVPTEDVWLENDEKISSRDINGLSEEQIKKIQTLAAKGKFPKRIKIKLGIKFVPILMLAFIVLIYLGNVLELLLL
jgi:preflagellin peptidase FlaK